MNDWLNDWLLLNIVNTHNIAVRLFVELYWGFPSTKLRADIITAVSIHARERRLFLCLDKVINWKGPLYLKGAMAGLVRSPCRFLKPCKSAIVWATRGAQGNPRLLLSRVWFKSGGHCRRDGGKKEGKAFYFPLSRWRLTHKTTRFLVLSTAWVCVCSDTCYVYSYICVVCTARCVLYMCACMKRIGFVRSLHNSILLRSLFLE